VLGGRGSGGRGDEARRDAARDTGTVLDRGWGIPLNGAGAGGRRKARKGDDEVEEVEEVAGGNRR
jgi:hypothetical protein